MAVRIGRHLDGIAAVNDGVALRMGDQEEGHGDLVIRAIALVHLDVVHLAFQGAGLEHVQSDIGHVDPPMGCD